MKKTDLAYIAGIVDGEGTIGIAKGRRRDSSQNWTYSLRVSVQMAEEHLPRWLQVSFGGLTYHREPREKQWKPQVQWIITGEQAGEFIKAIKPYLILKRAQAEIALKFLNIKNKGQRAKPFERYQQGLQKEEIAKLNKRGR